MAVHLSVVNFTHIVLYNLIPAVSFSWYSSVCSVVLRVATVNVLRCVNFCSCKLYLVPSFETHSLVMYAMNVLGCLPWARVLHKGLPTITGSFAKFVYMVLSNAPF